MPLIDRLADRRRACTNGVADALNSDQDGRLFRLAERRTVGPTQLRSPSVSGQCGSTTTEARSKTVAIEYLAFAGL